MDKIKIDFFCIGVSRSRSTWLYRCCSEHPNITVSKVKEPNFFVRYISDFSDQENSGFLHDWDWYLSLFDHHQPGDILGDFSVSLMPNKQDAPALLHHYFPKAKLVVLLRHPVDRTYSSYWYLKWRGTCPNLPNIFEEALEQPSLHFRSLYYEQLKVWLEYFPIEQFHFLLDIDLEDNTSAFLANLFAFLGVDKDFVPPSLEYRVNPALQQKIPLHYLQKVVKQIGERGYRRLIEILKVTNVWNLARSISRVPSRYPPMKAETRERLCSYYLHDIEDLEKLLGRRLEERKY